MIMDELYTFVGKKSKKHYVWASIAVTQTGKYFYFYHLSKYKNAGALFEFNMNLPTTDKIYCDGCFSYDKIYGDKASMEKSSKTNIRASLKTLTNSELYQEVRLCKTFFES